MNPVLSIFPYHFEQGLGLSRYLMNAATEDIDDIIRDTDIFIPGISSLFFIGMSSL